MFGRTHKATGRYEQAPDESRECMALEKPIPFQVREHRLAQRVHAAENSNKRTRNGDHEKKDDWFPPLLHVLNCLKLRRIIQI